MTTIQEIYSNYAKYAQANGVKTATPAQNPQLASASVFTQASQSNSVYAQARSIQAQTDAILGGLSAMPTNTTGTANPFNNANSVTNIANAAHMPMTSASNDSRAKKYEGILQNMQLNLSGTQKNELAKFKQIFEQNKGKYEGVARKLGVPEQLIPMVSKAIWAIHCREGGCDFTTYLHNGDKLGSPTKNVPAGINFNNWEDAAVDAIKRELPKVGGKMPQSVPEWCAFAELYNGVGYEKKGVASPYVLSGTDKYSGGKYVADGKYDANYKDKQLGFAALMLG
ncbi:MAG: hypothetical protein WCK67_07525 [bacterium]